MPLPPSGIPADFIFKNSGPSSCVFLTKWANLIKSNLELQWPSQGIFQFSKLTFLKRELDNHGSKIVRTEWNAYFNWYFEASKHYQESKIASLQHRISRLTEANN